MTALFKHLVEATNSRGMIVRSIEPWGINQYGPVKQVVIEGAEYRITFLTNVLGGTNYFKITKVEDLIKDRTYKSQRYFHKFILRISSINGQAYINIMKEELENGKQN